MNAKKLLALLLAVAMVLSVFAGCNNTKPNETTGNNESKPTETTGATEPPLVIETFPAGDYIWKSSVVTLASNWNPHTYQTADDSVPLDYTTSSLYTFIFNDELNPVEGKDAYEGYKIIPEMAAEMPIDVTKDIKASNPEFGIPATAEEGYAYKIVLNPNATWDDGTPITAQTYVESFKRLLNPKALNYRAADWYGQTLSIAGAENYNLQGTNKYAAIGKKVSDWAAVEGNDVTKLYVDMSFWGVMAPDGTKYAAVTDDTMVRDPAVAEGQPEDYVSGKYLYDTYLGPGCPYESYSKQYLVYVESVYPSNVGYETVGLIAKSDYELIIVLDKSLAGFDLLYNLSGVATQLVKIDLYDKCLKVEAGANGKEVYSSTYNTSAETTASFGPYKMSSFQSDKAMHFVRNDKWFGYTDGKHIYQDPEDGKIYPMYQTTEVDIQVVAESATRKLMFMRGELMGYGLQADDYATLRQSEYCYATPAETIFFLILNGHMEAIKEREASDGFDTATQDLEMLTNTTFHKAMGLTYDKDNFAATVSPARSGALGIIGNSYIYDPDAGARYRDTDQAKKVLCSFYGVDTTKFASLDDAVASITGYDPEQAKVYFKQAFEEGLAAGYITDANNDKICDQTIKIEYSMSSEMTDFMRKTLGYMNEKVAEVAKGTPFEGKIEFIPSAPYGNAWSDKLKAGQADTSLCGWQGSVLDPFGLTDLYTNPEKQYDAAWYNATAVNLTINVPVNGENKDVTLTLKQWSDVLNGTAVTVDGVEYNYGSGQADTEVRLNILAACEGKILESYNYLPMLQDGSMALLTQQVFYVVEEYNPILGRGGIAYTKYNYNEADWAAYVKAQGGELKY